jgi:acetone carboxylase, gamma subunit
MRVYITTALEIELEDETWRCAHCDHSIASARENYKTGCLVADRPPAEIHAPIIDADKYDITFSPDPDWCAILEFCCPSCGTLIEVEYLPPGHPPAYDIELDIDALRAQVEARPEQSGPVIGPDFVAPPHHGHGH